MKRFNIRVKGITPLLHHKMPEDVLFSLLGTKTKKVKDKEIKTPREIANKYAHRVGKNYVCPTTHIVGAFKAVASEFKQQASVRKSMKSIAGGIFRPEMEYVNLVDSKNRELKDFEVDVRKGVNHQKGAIAICRPRFDDWGCEFTARIDDELVSPEVVLEMLNDAGKRSGIGSFRVSKGGYFGQFIITDFKELK